MLHEVKIGDEALKTDGHNVWVIRKIRQPSTEKELEYLINIEIDFAQKLTVVKIKK